MTQIIYRIEDEFELIIPDAEIEKIISPQNVIDYLMKETEVGENCSEDYVAITVWRIIEEETGISPRDFDDDARFNEDMGLN